MKKQDSVNPFLGFLEAIKELENGKKAKANFAQIMANNAAKGFTKPKEVPKVPDGLTKINPMDLKEGDEFVYLHGGKSHDCTLRKIGTIPEFLTIYIHYLNHSTGGDETLIFREWIGDKIYVKNQLAESRMFFRLREGLRAVNPSSLIKGDKFIYEFEGKLYNCTIYLVEHIRQSSPKEVVEVLLSYFNNDTGCRGTLAFIFDIHTSELVPEFGITLYVRDKVEEPKEQPKEQPKEEPKIEYLKFSDLKVGDVVDFDFDGPMGNERFTDMVIEEIFHTTSLDVGKSVKFISKGNSLSFLLTETLISKITYSKEGISNITRSEVSSDSFIDQKIIGLTKLKQVVLQMNDNVPKQVTLFMNEAQLESLTNTYHDVSMLKEIFIGGFDNLDQTSTSYYKRAKIKSFTIIS